MRTAPISPSDPESLQLLLVEDDRDVAALMAQVFERNPDYASSLTAVTTLGAAVKAIEAVQYDAVLLDLGLPDSDGLRTTRSVLDAIAPPTAVVIVTAQRDQDLAASSLSLGVQDYVVKEDLTAQLVTRVVWYGVTRARLTEELAAARRGEERERELRRLERMAADSSTSVSAQMMGSGALSGRLGDRYESEVVAEYTRILQISMEEQAYRGTRLAGQDLRSLATVLGFLGAGPRDIVELHSLCLRRLLADLEPARASGAVEEARVLVLQLMGRLVTYYRDRSIRAAARPGTPKQARVDPKDPT